MAKCYECRKGNLKKKKVEYKLYGIVIGEYQAEVCDKCGETYFDSNALEKIEKKTKELGLFGLRKRVKVGTSGNALDIKLSKRFVDFFNIKKGQEVEIEPVDKNRFEVEVL